MEKRLRAPANNAVTEVCQGKLWLSCNRTPWFPGALLELFEANPRAIPVLACISQLLAGDRDPSMQWRRPKRSRRSEHFVALPGASATDQEGSSQGRRIQWSSDEHH